MLSNRTVFNVGAWLYDTFTSQAAWRSHCRRLSPPGFNPTSILDVGCGPGISSFVLEELHPSANIFGLDLANKMIKRAQQTKSKRGSRINFLVGNVEFLPYPDDYFDLITGHSFLYLLPDRVSALTEINRVLRPGGRITVLEPRKGPGLSWILPSMKKGFRFFSTMIGWQIFSGLHGRFKQEELKRLFVKSGFKSIQCEGTLNKLGWICRARKPT